MINRFVINVIRIFIFLVFLLNSVVRSQNLIKDEIAVLDKQFGYRITSAPFVDSTGDIWYSVNYKGIFCRFDGAKNNYYRFYKDDYRSSLYEYRIHHWVEDYKGRIWGISSKSIFIIDKKTSKIERLDISNLNFVEDENFVSGLFDKEHNLWMSINSHLLIKVSENLKITIFDRLDFEGFSIGKSYSNRMEKSGDKGIKIYAVLPDNTIVISYRSIIYYVKNNHVKRVEDVADLFTEKYTNYTVLLNDFLGRKSDGKYFYEGKKYDYKYFKNDKYVVVQLPENISSNFSIKGQNIFSISNKELSVFSLFKDSLSLVEGINYANRIEGNRLYPTKSDYFLVGSSKNVYRIKFNDLQIKKLLHNDRFNISTREIVSTQDGHILVGSYSGLYNISSSGKVLRGVDSLQNIKVSSTVIKTKNDQIWAVGHGKTLNKYNYQNNTFETHLESNNLIRDVIALNDNELLLRKGEIFTLFDIKNEIETPQLFLNKYFKNHEVMYFNKLSDRTLCFGTDKGLFLYDFVNHDMKKINFDTSNEFDRVLTVYFDTYQKQYYIGTLTKGVFVLDASYLFLYKIEEKDGLSSNAVCGISSTKNRLVFSTFNGISIYNRTEKIFKNLYEEDGITDNEFNSRSLLKLNDSIFYLGGVHGVNQINLNRIQFDDSYFKIKLVNISYNYNDKEINLPVVNAPQKIDPIYLKYNQNKLQLSITSHQAFDFKRLKYFYKIPGKIEGWTEISSDGHIILNSLPTGNYTVYIKAFRDDNIASQNSIQIPVIIDIAFYRDVRYQLALLAIVLIGLFLIYQYRIKVNRRNYNQLKDKVQLEAKVLRSQMNPHFIFNILNNLQSIILLKDVKTVNKNFSAFSKILRQTLDFTKNEWITLADEEKYLENYIVVNNLQFENVFKIELVGLSDIMDKENIYIPSMFLQPFIENAIVHGLMPKVSTDKWIKIHFKQKHNKLEITIEDNGIGRGQIINNDNKFHASNIINERIKIWDIEDKGSVQYHIEDKIDQGQKQGTIVHISIKIKKAIL